MSGFAVVDARLAFKWLVREEHTDKALAILRMWHNQEVTPVAPHLPPLTICGRRYGSRLPRRCSSTSVSHRGHVR